MSSKTILLGLGAAVKGRCMEDLLGSLLLTTVSQNGPKISPRGVEMPQLNAALMSALESVEWFVLRPSFFCFRQVEIDSNYSRRTNSLGSSQE